MILGCSGGDSVDLSDLETAVEEYIAALEDLDIDKMAKCRGIENAGKPYVKGDISSVKFSQMEIILISCNDNEAIVEAKYDVLVKVKGLTLPGDSQHWSYDLIKQDDKWVIAEETDLIH